MDTGQMIQDEVQSRDDEDVIEVYEGDYQITMMKYACATLLIIALSFCGASILSSYYEHVKAPQFSLGHQAAVASYDACLQAEYNIAQSNSKNGGLVTMDVSGCNNSLSLSNY